MASRAGLWTQVVPASLYDSLMARLDRSAPIKEVAQVGACIGREFSHELLAAAAGRPEPELRAALHQLIASELIIRRGKPPEAIYAFKHALVQEAAYHSLLRSRRRELHGAIAAILEEQFPDLADATPELLAHHLTEGARSELAADYWLKAGRRAAQASANVEAIGHFNRGLAVLGTLPDTDTRAQRDLELQLALGAAVRAAAWFTAAEARPVYSRALELAERLETPRGWSMPSGGCGGSHTLRAIGLERGSWLTALGSRSCAPAIPLRLRWATSCPGLTCSIRVSLSQPGRRLRRL